MTTQAVTPPANMDFEQMAAADAKAQSNSGTAPATATALPAAGMDFEQMAQQDAAKAASTTTAPHVPSSGEVLTDVLGGGPSNPLNTNAVNTALSQGMSGAIKSGGETAHTLGAVAGKLMPNSWRDALGLPSSFKQPDYLQSTSGAEIAGKVADNIAEFALSDEALKGLALAKRLGIAQKLHSMAESSPYIAKILEHGLTAIRGGAATVPQQMAHGATPTEALKTGAEATVLGAGAGAAMEGAGAAKNAVKGVLDAGTIQEPLQTGVRNTLGRVAEDTGVTKSAAPSIRKVAEDTADAVYAKSKQQYAILDEATGGRFQRFKDRLDNIRQSLNGLTGTEEDAAKEAKLLQAQHETEQSMQDAFADAKAKGVDPKLVDEANANFKKSQALYDLDSNIKKTVSGGRPGVTSADQLKKAQELIDPKKFLTRVNNLYDSGRLQEALGVQGADDLFNHAVENNTNYSQILRNQRLAKYGVVGLGATGIGGEVLKHALGE